MLLSSSVHIVKGRIVDGSDLGGSNKKQTHGWRRRRRPDLALGPLRIGWSRRAGWEGTETTPNVPRHPSRFFAVEWPARSKWMTSQQHSV